MIRRSGIEHGLTGGHQIILIHFVTQPVILAYIPVS